MSPNVKVEDFEDRTPVKVGRVLQSRGFVLGQGGRVIHSIEDLRNSSSLSVLYQKPEGRLHKYLFGFIKFGFIKPERLWIGDIRFPSRHNDQNWVFEVHGRVYLEQARQVAEELSEQFKIDITVKLETEQPLFEVPSGSVL